MESSRRNLGLQVALQNWPANPYHRKLEQDHGVAAGLQKPFFQRTAHNLMYIEQWDEFRKAVEELYITSPETTRYVSTFRHTDGVLILKVTNDKSVIKFQTDQQADLKKFILLNGELMAKMQNCVVPKEQDKPVIVPEPTPSSGPQIPQVGTAQKSTRAKKSKKRKA
ncbi:Signal recognition particle protein [Apophysomyces sp. BC1034]|nr:Signal recognition particle protein [Apophysomyces sp. BC1015]KAG0171342.1 Signal recognition particle protein [Apophysomyces sp. BC1021]KAG0184846.1 Signal recognition particle protein [Apophysomyces sp. BC1034]